MRLFESSAIIIDYDAQTKIMTQTWKGFSTSEKWREGIEKSIEFYKQYDIRWMLTDTLNAGIVKKEDTDWAADYAVPLLVKNGMRAQALIVPTNVFIQMSVKNFTLQTGDQFKIQYFDSMDKGREWLLSQ